FLKSNCLAKASKGQSFLEYLNEIYKGLLYLQATQNETSQILLCTSRVALVAIKVLLQMDVEFDSQHHIDWSIMARKTKTGTVRLICKACGLSFVERAKNRPSRAHEKPYRAEDIVMGLVNGSSFNRMMEVYKVNPSTIYHYIEKAYDSCVRFNKNRDERLLDVLSKRKIVYFATDRQDILVNWNDRTKRNAIALKATCSVDVRTAFIYRYDVGIDDITCADTVHRESIENGDVDKALLFRKYPHLFLPSDMGDEKRINGYVEQLRHQELLKNPSITEEELKYLEVQIRPDVEPPSFHLTTGTGLPKDCLLLREDYQLYAHYFALKSIFENTVQAINFADQESGLRAAFMSAFADKVANNKAHLFYITYSKGSTREQREEANARTKALLAKTIKKYDCDEKTAKHILCVEAIMKYTSPVGQWRDLWGYHPLESMTEVHKRFSHQTYKPTQSAYEIGYYLKEAGLHVVDNHFMRVRRRVSHLERAFATASNDKKLWYGKNFYRPDMAKKSAAILMTYLNYCTMWNKKSATPAEKLGMAKGPVRLKDILDY
ncbi:MAG: hypothetical protein ACXW1W_09945, partial [Methylococcaceae bacterium]